MVNGVLIFLFFVKGIGWFFFLKRIVKNKTAEEKKQTNYASLLRSNNYEVYTAVARCIPNVLDVMVMVRENINLKKS
jgi:hypothetical protein